MPDSNITKMALASAMKELMEKTPFSKISVGDICELCQMNRKSFYYHFQDKYDLVNWIYSTEFIATVQKKKYLNGWELFEDICAYFEENRRFYVNALQVSGQNSFHEFFEAMLQKIVRGYLEDEILLQSAHTTFFAVFFTDAFVAAIQRWLNENAGLSAHDFVGLLREAVGGVAKKIVEDMERGTL